MSWLPTCSPTGVFYPCTTKQPWNALQSAGKCIYESLKFKIFWGSMPPNPPSREAASGLSKCYPPGIRNYLLVPRLQAVVIFLWDSGAHNSDFASSKRAVRIKGINCVLPSTIPKKNNDCSQSNLYQNLMKPLTASATSPCDQIRKSTNQNQIRLSLWPVPLHKTLQGTCYF